MSQLPNRLHRYLNEKGDHLEKLKIEAVLNIWDSLFSIKKPTTENFPR